MVADFHFRGSFVNRFAFRAVIASLAALSLLACGLNPVPDEPEIRALKSDKQRITNPAVTDAEIVQQSADNAAFGFDFYRAVRAEKSGNLVFSPLSLSTALAMTYAGARNNTATELRSALRWTLGDDKVHSAFNAIDLKISSHGENQTGVDGQPFRLRSVNASWSQDGFGIKTDYLDALALNYGAALNVLDFQRQPEPSRQTINDWVSYQTEGRIPELLAKGTVDESTRIVLTNAVYFNASWATPFETSATANGDFHKLDGSTLSVPMMHGTSYRLVGHGQDFTTVSLPYAGNELDFVIVLPDSGKFEQVESALTPSALETALASATSADVALSFPKFKLDEEVPALGALQSLGVHDLFADAADLSGIDGSRDLQVTGVLHKVFISVDEKGTEAAAATGVIAGITSVPVITPIDVDRPFLFVIRDRETKTVVFMGGIVEPKL